MYLNDNPPMIYSPQSVTELLVIYKKNPDAQLFAGGTWTIGHQTEKFLRLNKTVIYLGRLEELKKISRSERYIDFGSCGALSDILNLKTRIIPPILHNAVKCIATPQVRNLATIGGNIAVPGQRMSLFPALMVLDARIELRKQGAARWTELRRFIKEDNNIDIREGEIITRIRIPIEEWDFQQYKSIGERMQLDRNYLVSAFLCKINKNVVTEARSILIDGHKTIFRPFQTEGNIIGARLPLSEKDQNELLDIFRKELNYNTANTEQIASSQFMRLFHWMLTELSEH